MRTLVLAGILALVGCTAVEPAASSSLAETACSDAPRARLEVLVEPEATVTPVVNLIASATSSIDVIIYQLSNFDIVDALALAPARGVHVRVIIDHAQAHPDIVARLTAAGADVRMSSSEFTNTHEKTIIVDHTKALVFSGNFDKQTFLRGRNYGVIDSDARDVADLDAVFAADWNGQTPDLACTRMVIAPTNARSKVTELIASAERTLDIEAMYVTDYDINAAVLAAVDRGVTVRLAVNDPHFGQGDSSYLVGKLKEHGMAVKRSGDRFLHAKMLLVDGERAFLGSENFSRTALDKNREAGVIVSKDDADLGSIAQTFERDWAEFPGFDAAAE